jgi:tRNA(fMet)-specific endonuclease VapC
MKCLDTSFLVDYLDGHASAKEFLDAHAETPLFAPTLSLFEVYRGAARSGGRDAAAEAVTALDWVEPLPLDAASAREAALIEDELRSSGSPINLGDVLIAGIVRNAGGSVVTSDADFTSVPDLDVVQYRS